MPCAGSVQRAHAGESAHKDGGPFRVGRSAGGMFSLLWACVLLLMHVGSMPATYQYWWNPCDPVPCKGREDERVHVCQLVGRHVPLNELAEWGSSGCTPRFVPPRLGHCSVTSGERVSGVRVGMW